MVLAAFILLCIACAVLLVDAFTPRGSLALLPLGVALAAAAHAVLLIPRLD